MDTPNKRPDAAVDEILEELRAKSGAPAKTADNDLDSILASLKERAPGAPPVAAAPEVPKVPVVSTPAAPEPGQAVGQSAEESSVQQTVVTEETVTVQSTVEVREAVAVQPDVPPAGNRAGVETTTFEALGSATISETRRLPVLGNPGNLEPIGHRSGKAAALEKVDKDKFTKDEELASWFSSETELHTSKRDMKRAEKARNKQLKEDEKERKRMVRQGGGQEASIAQPDDGGQQLREAFEEIQRPPAEPAEPRRQAPPARASAEPRQQAAAPVTPVEEFATAQKAELPEGGMSLFEFAQQQEAPRTAAPSAMAKKPEPAAPGIPQQKKTAPVAPTGPRRDVQVQQAEAQRPAQQAKQAAQAAGRPQVRQQTQTAQQAVKPQQPPQPKPPGEKTLAFQAIRGAVEQQLNDEARPAAKKGAAQAAKQASAQSVPTSKTAAQTVSAPKVPAQAAPVPKASTQAVSVPKAPTSAAPAPTASVPKPAAPVVAKPQVKASVAGQGVKGPTALAGGVAAAAQAATAESGKTQVFKAQAAVQAEAAKAAGSAAAETRAFSGTEAAAGAAKAADGAGGRAAQNEGADNKTQVFSAPDATVQFEPGAAAEKNGRVSTKQFDIAGEEEMRRVPTAAYTQEFETGEEPPTDATRVVETDEGKGVGQGQKNLFVDEMVDDKFKAFFGETVIVEREELEQSQKLKPRRKARKSRTALLTGEFAKMTEAAEDENEEDFDDYSKPQDAEQVEADLVALRKTLAIRSILSGVGALLLFWLAFGYTGVLPLPEFMSLATGPLVFAGVYLVLIIGVIILNFTTVASGLIGLFSEPTTDTSGAIAAVAALLQGVVLFVQLLTGAPVDITLFGAIAALILCFNSLGKRVRSTAILENFRLASGGLEHSAAYILDGGQEVAYNITKGLEEDNPSILISRPTALVKGFLRQSFSMRWSDGVGRIMGWALLGVSLVVAVIAYITSRELIDAITCLAAAACIGAPLSATLISGIPSRLLQMGSGKVGAVVPGWSAIEELGNVNVVMAGARDIFPPNTVFLKGIKTFEQERVDLAILYAASVLVEGCDTLRDIFLAVIQGKSDMLFKVENLMNEPGRGFMGFVDNNRVIIGTREMMQMHDIDPPPLEVEMKYTSEGNLPVYLAVSGKLFAMFIIAYAPDSDVQETLDGLIKSGVSMLVTSDDPNVTDELIEQVYQLPKGVVKVLGRRELSLLEPLRSYLPESEGVMTHIGTFTSFIGGMRAAAGCAASERMSTFVQIASVALACLLCVLLVFSGGLPILSLSIVLLYQLGWTLLVSALPFARRY